MNAVLKLAMADMKAVVVWIFLKEALVLPLQSVVKHTVLELIAPTVAALVILALIQVAAQEYVLIAFGMIVKQKTPPKIGGVLLILLSDYFFRTTTPGSSLPSIHSKKAPPAVEM